MAYANGLGDRPDDRRFRSPQSPREESTFPSFTSPIRSIASQMQAHTSTANDARASLTRRFTTNTVPQMPTLSPLSPIGQQRRQAAENTELTSAVSDSWSLAKRPVCHTLLFLLSRPAIRAFAGRSTLWSQAACPRRSMWRLAVRAQLRPTAGLAVD